MALISAPFPEKLLHSPLTPPLPAIAMEVSVIKQLASTNRIKILALTFSSGGK